MCNDGIPTACHGRGSERWRRIAHCDLDRVQLRVALVVVSWRWAGGTLPQPFRLGVNVSYDPTIALTAGGGGSGSGAVSPYFLI